MIISKKLKCLTDLSQLTMVNRINIEIKQYIIIQVPHKSILNKTIIEILQIKFKFKVKMTNIRIHIKLKLQDFKHKKLII